MTGEKYELVVRLSPGAVPLPARVGVDAGSRLDRRARRARTASLSSTALVGFAIFTAAGFLPLTLLAFSTTPALAQGGAGGDTLFADGVFGTGGAGGSGPNGGAGSPGTVALGIGAGGGGGGAGGGSGGTGGGVGGGAGGFSSGAPGSDGASDGAGGGGGAGGVNAFTGSPLNNSATLTGGKGGNGGASGGPSGNSGGGGGGGEGGYGAVINAISNANVNSGTILGGNGGIGGASGGGGGAIGDSGSGGVGVFFSTSGTLTNSGSITGGNGGAAGTTSFGHGPSGNGGAGIVGAGLVIVNSSVIMGGLSGDGVTRANAITFTGGTNVLELRPGSAITGNVIAFSAADTFRLGGSTDTTFNTSAIGPGAQYQGFGVFEKNGPNTWSLTGTPGSNTPWAISQGTLLAAAATNVFGPTSAITVNPLGTLDLGGFNQQIGSLTGNGTVTDNGVSLNAALTTGADNSSTTFAGLLTDGSHKLGLTKIGNGNFILSGVSTYTGVTTVNAGTLSVNGSIASSSVIVNAGGTLGGNGTVGAININGGTLSPGNSIGLLTVQGNFAFTAAASYMVEVSPSNADRINASGTATLGGATVNASFAPGAYAARKYTIISAPSGGVSGTFGSLVNTNLPVNFQSSLSYDANDVYLNLALSFPTSGLNVNQRNVANAIEGFFNANPGIPLVFGGLTPAGLTEASGELATGSQQTTFDTMTQFMGVMTDPFIGGRGDRITAGSGATPFAEEIDGANAYAAKDPARSKRERDAYAAIYRKAPAMAAPFNPSWSVWAAGFGGSQTTDGNAALGSNSTTSRLGAIAVGADYRFSPNTIAGFALAGGGTNFSVNGFGAGRSDLFQAGAFVRHTVGPAYFTAALAYGWQDITTDRTLTIAGIDQLRARFNANAFSGRIEDGYRFVTPWMGVTPYAAGQFTTFELPAYAEQAIVGANTFALAYGAKSVTAPRSEVGVRTDKSWAMPDSIFTLRGRFAWAHDYNTDRSIGATFQTLPGASFVVNGAAQAHDSALTTAAAEMKWLNGFSLAATFEGEFSSVTKSYAGKGVARYVW